MARRVFFSFHYDDVTRANIVRNCDVVTRKYEQRIRFYDRSLWESAKKHGPVAIKRMINGALEGSSVTCVLVGQQTWCRPWVRYEVLKSMARGNGILAVQVHDVGFASGGQPPAMPLGLGGPSVFSRGYGIPQAPPSRGANPLSFLGYIIEPQRGTVRFYERVNSAWKLSDHVEPVGLGSLLWLSGHSNSGRLDQLFPSYGWKADNGSQHFDKWVEAAAQRVGR
jgi:hypothetical protein